MCYDLSIQNAIFCLLRDLLNTRGLWIYSRRLVFFIVFAFIYVRLTIINIVAPVLLLETTVLIGALRVAMDRPVLREMTVLCFLLFTFILSDHLIKNICSTYFSPGNCMFRSCSRWAFSTGKVYVISPVCAAVMYIF